MQTNEDPAFLTNFTRKIKKGYLKFDELFSKAISTIPERLIQAMMVIFLIGWLTIQVSLYSWYYNKVQWFLETSLYAVYLMAYLRRPAAKDRAKHFHEVVIPLLGASLPFSFLLTPVSVSPQMFPIVLWLLSGSVALVILAAISLGKSFSITVDVRQLRQTGMYRIIRHPMYASQILSAIIMCLLLRYSPVNVLLLIAFIMIQTIRAKMEEQKLLKYFPEEYREYKRKTKMFIPFIF